MVYTFFGEDRINAWLPGNRIISHLQGVEVRLSERARCQAACLNLELGDLKALIDQSKPDLEESDVRGGECPVYQLNGHHTELKDFGIKIESCKENALILNIEVATTSCDC